MNQHTHGSFEQNFENYRTKPDGKQDPAGEAGWFLQRERERRKTSLRDVANAIRVHPIHLDAIERGDLTRMPHRSDAIGMVGAYAEFLGFDPQPMMMHYAQLLPRSSAPKQPGNKTPKPLGSARIIEFPMARRLKEIASGPGGVVASVAVAVMLFGGVAFTLLPGGEQATPELAQTNAQQEQVVAGGASTEVAATSQQSETAMPDAAPVQQAENAPDRCNRSDWRIAGRAGRQGGRRIERARQADRQQRRDRQDHDGDDPCTGCGNQACPGRQRRPDFWCGQYRCPSCAEGNGSGVGAYRGWQGQGNPDRDADVG
jgi:hypothetical protein